MLVWENACNTIFYPRQILINKALKIMAFSSFGRVDIEPLSSFYSWVCNYKLKKEILLFLKK